MANNRRFNPDERAEIVQKAWDLRLKGMNLLEIGDELKKQTGHEIDKSTISRMLKEHRNRIVPLVQANELKKISGMLSSYEDIKRLAMEDYLKSRENEISIEKTIGHKDGDTVKTVTKTRVVGDPKYLTVATEALNQMQKLLGTDKGTKIKVVGDAEHPVPVSVEHGFALGAFADSLAAELAIIKEASEASTTEEPEVDSAIAPD
ncbi:MAG: hypothetical protein ABJA67_03000 [Chthonomonadales bacterium]